MYLPHPGVAAKLPYQGGYTGQAGAASTPAQDITHKTLAYTKELMTRT